MNETNAETPTPEPGLRKLVYTLIIYPDDPHGPIAVVCDTPEQREQKTIEAIFGEDKIAEPHVSEWEKMRGQLLETGTLNFEGDAPLQWLTEWANFNPLQADLTKARADLAAAEESRSLGYFHKRLMQLTAQLAEAEASKGRLRVALTFYASRENYSTNGEVGEGFGLSEKKHMRDFGKVAKEALAEPGASESGAGKGAQS
jgi:hypothetical protein